MKNHSKISHLDNIGDCSLVAENIGSSKSGQMISVDSFSVLIDSGEAGYNLSCVAGCLHDFSNNISVFIIFFRADFFWIDHHRSKSQMTTKNSYKTILLS